MTKSEMIFFVFLVAIVDTLEAQVDNVNDKLSENPTCRGDMIVLKEICDKTSSELSNNWVFLDCVDSIAGVGGKSLTQECSTTVWNFKMKVSHQDVFLNQSRAVCGEELVTECGAETEKGYLLACMVESRGKVKELQCAQFLGQVERIIFSDWRIISRFMTECEADVVKLHCGAAMQREGQMHSQEDTITCLTNNIAEVKPDCRKEILTIAELQADDYHLDRELYLACKADRETVCPHTQAGEGRVYHCLAQNKDKVSAACKEQINRRQIIAAEDYRADGSLVTACKEEMKRFHCTASLKEGEAVKLAAVLLCLEDNIREGQQVGAQCVGEMREIRRSLMEDFSITPELVTNCKHEISSYCPPGVRGQGQTIHCLMKTVIEQNKARESNDRAAQGFGIQCEKALNNLLAEAQINSDWQADPVLEDACEEVVFAACDPKQGGDAVMSCLMEALAKGSPSMTSSCSEVLLQIHYFLARDVLVDEHLYAACQADAARVCNGKTGWHSDSRDSRHILVFPCLVRNLYNDDSDDEDESGQPLVQEGKHTKTVLSDQCTDEVERTLRQRAMSVQLHPEVEEVCRVHLHTYCGKHVEPGEELQCLQTNYEVLDNDCKKVVARYIKIEARNPFLHPIVTKACGKVIDRKCGSESKASDGAGVMECLIRYKMEHPPGTQGAINLKCRTVVEHWQIITLQDWKFSYKFKEACKEDIREHCVNPKPKKKADVVSCLVMIISNDTVLEEKHRVKKACRAEVRFELLARHSDLAMDPRLAVACREEVVEHCSTQDIEEDGGLECLKGIKHRDIGKKCKKLLFEEEKEEAEDSEVDFTLLRGCKREIQQHCPDEHTDNMIHCLKDFSQDANFDQSCLTIIRRRTAQRMKDFRLNLGLRKACKQDIPKFCGTLLAGKDRVEEEFFEGKVIECLKERVIQKEARLSDSCHQQMLGLMEDVATSIEADPILEESCSASIARCKARPDVRTGLQIHECLKQLFENKQLEGGDGCNRHIALIIEGTSADIHVDPVLHSACSLDLQKFCRDVPQGQGKLLACLVRASRETSFTMEPECGVVLAKRIHMYDLAIKVAPMETAAELYRSVMESQHRNYFLTVSFIFLCIIFIFGLCFGRVSYRLKGEMKNR